MYFDRFAYGVRVRRLRLDKGLTQEQLAEKICVSGTYIGKIETGKQVGSVELAIELAELFRVPLDYLLLGKPIRDGDRKQQLWEVIRFLISLENEL